MTHDPAVDPAVEEMFTQEFWDTRYRTADRLWSGAANPHLVAVAESLAPAEALDVGSGEGGDAIWLATRGWRVTALDVSQVALDRTVEHAASAGVQDRITVERADVLAWTPPSSRYDLVSAQFLHLPAARRAALHRGLAAAVRPGGSLLVVGHHPSDLETTMRRPRLPDLMFTAEEVSAELDPAEWRIVVAAAPERTALDPSGEPVTIRDTVLHAVRRS